MLRRTVLTTAAAAGAVCAALAIPQTASARVVCNAFGDCWSTRAVVTYPRTLGVHVYSDRYADDRYRERQWRRYHRHWRGADHAGDRGYYCSGVWVPF